ncbi:di-heme oxidoredictase family protein [Vulgatibacter sp.]|uniref:di-heme oxidoredictase family protein n=1 Tax=Vulgatibacter sp. TaxID=1971226 RepID=UPI00356B0DBB
MYRKLLPLALIAAGCSAAEHEPEAPPLSREIFAPLGSPLPFATPAQRADFERGRELAERIFTEADGLGPRFNTVTCAGCHEKPVVGGTSGRFRNIYLTGSTTPDGRFLPSPGGGVAHGYGLGEAGVRPRIPAEMDVSGQRNALPFFGAGLIAEIPDAALLALEDPDDADGDGISGRVNRERGQVARFGRKAQTTFLEGFVRGPLNNHIGITTNRLTDAERRRLPFPPPVRNAATAAGLQSVQQGQVAPKDNPIVDADLVPDPELGAEDLFALVSFTMLLAPPPPDAPTPQTSEGAAHFEAIGCAACHVPSLEGPRGPIPLYSDLLLHDMGPEMSDGIEMWDATPSEFRTQPLWGVAAAAPYLHDGRADTLEEAIAWHGGEAAASRQRYDALQPAERAAILAFLGSLGGAAERTEGMLPQQAPIPEVGAPGGPLRPLDDAERDLWLEGRQLFDRDAALAEGLGSPHFNGDSCRSCHDRPVIGGGGKLDVTVVRAGKWVSDTFFAPFPGSTILPRVSPPWLPRVEANYTDVERRKSPSSLGLGLVEGIAEAAILANADPDDADGDGIRGRASRLADGRLGRFGWKADVPSLAEFVRDAFSNELGFSLAAAEGLTFGSATDEDGVADPEIATGPQEAMTFFLRQLAPLAPTASEPEGASIFAAIGCDGCHVPELDGVPLYSDLLLHDVAPAEYRGIPTATTGGREFRTPPLWGVSRTGPWMHDAGAPTLEEAIYRHSGTALASRRAFSDLQPAEQAALLRFLEAL